IAPDGLYKNGIHRDRFIPTIEMVKKNCVVLNVDAGVDYVGQKVYLTLYEHVA
ncbi:hypothetical protein BXA18_22390, partial [Acinetobacter baumannii]